MQDLSFNGNSASNQGGALYLIQSTATMQDLSFNGNSAFYYYEGADVYSETSSINALDVTTDATASDAWYLLGGTHYLYHFDCCGQSDPTDVENGGIVTTASAITYGLDNYWTWPCEPGTFSADGYEHGGSINAADPTCEVDSTGSCTIGSPSTSCPLAGSCPDACTPCPSGSYLEIADDAFNKHFQHISQDACALCPVGKWQSDTGSQTADAHDSIKDCNDCRCGLVV